MATATDPIPAPGTRRPYGVLHVGKYYAPYAGGIESHLQGLCERLRDRVALQVLVANEGRAHRVDLVNGVRVERAATRATLAGAPLCPSMVTRIRDARADIVHLHLPNPGAVLAYLASGHRGRLVVSYHSDVVRQRVLGAAFEPLQQRVLRRADAILVASPNYLESSPALLPHRARCLIVPYGITDADFHASDDEVRDLRRRFGPRVVLSVGRLVYYKGFEHVIDAMARVDAHLVIVGDGPLRPQLEARARAAGVAERVSFVGRVERTAPYYHLADVFVLASVARSEAFGIVQLEAMACGTPVVNTGLPSGVPFVSRHGETGITVRPGDAPGLAGAITRLLDDPQLRSTYGRAARERVQAEFDEGRMADRILGVYDEIAPGGLGLQRRFARRSGVDLAR